MVTAGEGSSPRTLKIAAAIAMAIVFARSFVFVFCEGANFDSNQAVFGLMAKHLAELRAFPLFAYGQSHMLAVTTWLATPFVALMGSTVLALKLPILVINLACAFLLVIRLVRDAGLDPRAAVVAAIPFLLPPVAVATMLTQHAGGNVEPFLYVLLLWMLRERPLAFGAIAAIGFLQREFTAYGVVALLLLQVLPRASQARPRARFWLTSGTAFAIVWAIVELLRPFTTYPPLLKVRFGWGGVEPAYSRLLEMVQRLLPNLYGLPETGNASAAAVVAPLAMAAVAALAVRNLTRIGRAGGASEKLDFALYLLLIGVQSAAAYVLIGSGGGGVRYILLGLLVPIAIFAAADRLEPSSVIRRAAFAAMVFWGGVNAVGLTRLTATYVMGPPENPYRVLADDLMRRGIRYGAADYWTAYHVSYLTGEKVKLHARGFNRVGEYRALFLDHLAEAVDIRLDGAACPDGRTVAHFCVVGPPAPRWRTPRS